MKLGYSQVETMQGALNALLRMYGVRRDEFLSRDRSDRLVRPRHMLCHILMEMGFSSPEIGRVIHRDPSLVRYGVRSVSSWIGLTVRNREEYQRIRRVVRKEALNG